MGDHLYVYDINSKINNNNNVNTCSITSSSLYNTQPPDEISMFLHQIIYRSSSSSSTSSSVMADALPYTKGTNSQPLTTSHGIFAGDPVNMTSGGEFLSGNLNVSGSNVSSSTVGVTENETVDEHERDYESEEGNEAVADEGPAKPAARCSKRTRAAEVHNMSEKRRRSRINEKMKALQKLIPNSNKTDKASMLDEAIEYLKQLQLQVQVLTMRNEFSFHPLAMPGLLPPFQFSRMRIGFGRENGSLHMNSSGTLTMNHETPSQTMFSLPSQCSASNELQVPNISKMINSGTSVGLDSCALTHFGPFQPCTTSGETCGEDILRHQQLNLNRSESNLSEFEIGTTATVLLPFDTQASDPKDSGLFEACMIVRDQADGVHSTNMDYSLILSPHLTGMQTGISVPRDDIKLEGKDF